MNAHAPDPAPNLPPPATVPGKLFASFYALYSGVMLLACVGVLLAPGLHRIMHTLHVPTDEGG